MFHDRMQRVACVDKLVAYLKKVILHIRPCPNREIDPPGGRRYRYREATGMLLIG